MTLTGLKIMGKRYTKKTQMDNTSFKRSLKLTKTIKGNVLRRNIIQEYFHKNILLKKLAKDMENIG